MAQEQDNFDKKCKNEEFVPDFDIEKFNENTYDTLRVLYLHHFSKIAEENEKLKQPDFISIWSTQRNEVYVKIVKASTKKEAFVKLLMNCDESIYIFIIDRNARQFCPKYDKSRETIALKLIQMGLMEDRGKYCKIGDVWNQNRSYFQEQYRQFVQDNLEDIIHAFENGSYDYFRIEKIDENLIIE